MRSNRGDGSSGVNVLVLIVVFVFVVFLIGGFTLYFATRASAAGLQSMCSVDFSIRNKFASFGTAGEIAANLFLPIPTTCGEIIQTPCDTEKDCIEQIQYRIKEVCWVRGANGASRGSIPCVNSMPIGKISGSIEPKDVCGPDWAFKSTGVLQQYDKLCETSTASGGLTGFKSGIPVDRIVWMPPQKGSTAPMNAVEHASITMRYTNGRIEISCISPYQECSGKPTPVH